MSAAHAVETNAPKSAAVDVLTAEVRAVMVGNRQVTLSVYRQLDWVEPDHIEPWGRVRATKGEDAIELIGRDPNGNLVASSVDPVRNYVPLGQASDYTDWIAVAPARTTTELTILEEGPYRAMIWVPGGGPGFHGTVAQASFVSAEGERQLKDLARSAIARQRQRAAFVEALAQLPLIVLAGLR